MTAQKLNPPTIAAPVGAYTHGMLAPAAGQWLYVSGQIGVHPDGSLATGFADRHLVKVTTYLTNAADLKDLNPVRARFLKDARPASTLVIVQALARAEWLFEVEAVAFRA